MENLVTQAMNAMHADEKSRPGAIESTAVAIEDLLFQVRNSCVCVCAKHVSTLANTTFVFDLWSYQLQLSSI